MQRPAPRVLVLAIALGAIAAIAAASSLASLFSVATRRPTDARAIYGINLSMYGPNAPEQFIDDPRTQALFARLAVPFVRIPIRTGAPVARLLAAMRAVKAAHATPVIILHGPVVADARAVDLRLLDGVKSVFGSRRVYLEIGNEEDQAGIDAQRYTAAWHTIVSALRARSPRSYRYGGPVTASANPDYVAYFVRHATPRPDFVSWHEYVCGPQDSEQYCLAHLAGWATHVASTNARVRAAIGTTLPIMFTEWNLDAATDPRYGHAAFISHWVTSALAELRRLLTQGLSAAIYYTATANQDDLVTPSGAFTPEGAAWRAALAADAHG